jgi:hypothetical protein
MDPGGFAAALSDPLFKYKRAAPSLLQPSSLPASFSFFQTLLLLHVITKMASTELYYDNERTVYAKICLKRT